MQRISAQTPSHFKKIRKIGIVLVSISTSILASPVPLPDLVNTIATYLWVAGSVAIAVSQTAAETDEVKEEKTPAGNLQSVSDKT